MIVEGSDSDAVSDTVSVGGAGVAGCTGGTGGVGGPGGKDGGVAADTVPGTESDVNNCGDVISSIRLIVVVRTPVSLLANDIGICILEGIALSIDFIAVVKISVVGVAADGSCSRVGDNSIAELACAT